MGYSSITSAEKLKELIHTVNGKDFVEAMLRAQGIQAGGSFGSLSNRLSQTVPGLMTTLGSRGFELLMDLDTSPGYASFRSFIKNAADALDPTSSTGQQIRDALADTFNGIFGDVFGQFSGPNGAQKLADVIRNDILPAVKEFGAQLRDILSVVMDIVKVASDAIRMWRGVAAGTAVTGDMVGVDLTTSANSAALQGKYVGMSVWQAMQSEMTNGTPAIGSAAASMGDAASIGLQSNLQIQSPSKVFRDFGAMTVEGWRIGLMSGIPDSDAAIARLGAVPSGTSMGGSGGRAPITVQLAINVDAKGASPDDASGIADKIGDALPAAIVRVFDMIGSQYGSP
jgi:hypothetical protein